MLFSSLSRPPWRVRPPLSLVLVLLFIAMQMLLCVITHRPSAQALWLHLAGSCWRRHGIASGPRGDESGLIGGWHSETPSGRAGAVVRCQNRA